MNSNMVNGTFEALMADIEIAISEANSPDGGGWKMTWRGLVVTTQDSRDPSRSNNGGEYFYYRVYHPDGLGIQVIDDWSCDFADRRGDEMYYNCLISANGLERMAKLAEVTLAARSWLNKEPGSMRLLKQAIRSLS